MVPSKAAWGIERMCELEKVEVKANFFNWTCVPLALRRRNMRLSFLLKKQAHVDGVTRGHSLIDGREIGPYANSVVFVTRDIEDRVLIMGVL
jgi:hypothetical protein